MDNNLHDYIVKNKNWEQLWANDNVAYWFEKIDDDHSIGLIGERGYKYCVNETTSAGTFKRQFCKDLTQAMSVWNNLIEAGRQ